MVSLEETPWTQSHNCKKRSIRSTLSKKKRPMAEEETARAYQADFDFSELTYQYQALIKTGQALHRLLRQAWAELVQVKWGEGTAAGTRFLADVEVALAEWEELA